MNTITKTTQITFAQFCRIFADVIAKAAEEGYDQAELKQGGIHMCLVFDEDFSPGTEGEAIENTVRRRLEGLISEENFYGHGRKLVDMIREIERTYPFGQDFSHRMVERYFREDGDDCEPELFDRARVLWLREIAAEEESRLDPKIAHGRALIDGVLREVGRLKECVNKGHEFGDLTGYSYSILNLAEALHNLTEELEMKKIARAAKGPKVEPSNLQEMGTGFQWAKLPE